MTTIELQELDELATEWRETRSAAIRRAVREAHARVVAETRDR
jgi:predicted transcriptional regulator